jgi:hypothetical protein
VADITIADVRAKYPQYHDMSDDQLAQGLHQKFYADMPYEQFSAKIGLGPKMTQPNISTEGMPPAQVSRPPPSALETIGNTIHDLPDALATTVSHGVSSVLAPPTALAARGLATISGRDPNADAAAVHHFFDTTGTYHAVTPGGQATENDASAAGRAISAPVARVAGGIENAAERAVPGAAQRIENTAGAANDVIGSLPVVGGLTRAASIAGEAAPQVARGAADVAREAGYTGLKTRADLKTPGAQNITDSLIAHDAGVVPGSKINVASVQNGRAIGPARVYNRMESSMPAKLTHDDNLTADLRAVGDSTSQLPRSPDVDALRESMLDQPELTSKELFANIREARARSAAALASDDPDKAALGRAYGQLANAYEDFAGRNIPKNSTVTLEDWQAARTKFAKSFLAEEALKGGEHFDPAVYGRAAQADPTLLTGGGKVVADIHNALPAGSGEAAQRGVGALIGGVAGAAAEHAAGGGFGMGGTTGAVIGSQAAPAVRGAIRGYATRGNPTAAAAAPTNPALSYVYDSGRAPPAPPPVPPPHQFELEPGGSIDQYRGGQTTLPLHGGSPSPFAPPPGKVGTPPLGAVLARNTGRLPVAQQPPEGRGTVPPQRVVVPPHVDENPTPPSGPAPQPLPVPAAGVQPPEGQLPRRLGDFLRGGGSEPLPSTAPPSPKAKPEGGDAATERLFEEAVARDAERAHAANAKNGGKTKRQLGEELARRSARRASDANGE